MTDPRRLAHAMNPRPFAHPVNRDDPLGPSILKEAEEERQELIRRAEGVLVELQAENARLRMALAAARHDLHEIEAGDMSTFEAIDAIDTALNATGPVVLATPDVVKTMVKETREKALEDAISAIEPHPKATFHTVATLTIAQQAIRALKDQPNE